MERTTVSLQAAVAMCAATAVVFLAGVFAAHAWPGRPGVEARSFFTVAGTVTGVEGGLRSLRITFRKTGAMPCAVTATGDDLRYDAPNFTAQVPYEACTRGFFDGSDVSFDVAVNDTSIVGPDGGFQVNPVPYAQFASVAGTARQYETPDCPAGYDRVYDDGFASGDATIRRLCRRPMQGGFEDIVRVGSGSSAFWIDRWEATVNTARNGSGTWYFNAPSGVVTVPAPPASFPPNGQWNLTSGAAPPYALSVPWNLPPARGITWFQSMEACAASGKRLPTREEWLRAAQGTNGDSTRGCNLTPGGPLLPPGSNPACVSAWGAADMIGNLWEWTDEWYAGAGSSLTLDLSTAQPRVDAGLLPDAVVPSLSPMLTNIGGLPWPSDYGDDTTYNVNAFTQRAIDNVSGLPAAAARGGSRSVGTAAGVFALLLVHAPSSSTTDLGFRCVIPR